MANQAIILQDREYTYTVPETISSGVSIDVSTYTKIKHPNLFIDMQAAYSYTQFIALFRIIMSLQPLIKSNFHHRGDLTIRAKNVYWNHDSKIIEVTLPLHDFGVTPSHYDELEKALVAMSAISVTFPQYSSLSEQELATTGGLCRVAINRKQKRKYQAHFFFHEEIIKNIVDPHNGFSQILKETVEKIRSIYTAKLYFLICRRADKGRWQIEYQKLRKLLNIAPDKYKVYKDFKKRILKYSANELRNSTNHWFAFYERFPVKSNTPDVIYFYIYNGKVTDQEQRDFHNRIARIKDTGMYLGVSDVAIKQITAKITVENSQYIYGKSNEVLAYISDNSETIIDRAAYYRKAIENIIYKDMFNTKELQTEFNFSTLQNQQNESFNNSQPQRRSR